MQDLNLNKEVEIKSDTTVSHCRILSSLV